MDRRSREKEVFLAAIALASDSERAAYVATACRGDESLRVSVEQLLERHLRPDDLIDAAAFQPAGPIAPKVLNVSGTHIGPYFLEKLIDEGGFGYVYLATQEKPVKRQVALKVVKPGMDTRQILARFDVERQALAMMDHPNIARVHDVGATEQGRPYFAMELVDGLSITKHCDRHRLTISERLELFTKVCDAIQHAHQKGVIHRDIKPSNILIARSDGRFVPKVIDFGVAKALNQQLTDHSMAATGLMMLGTPLYMSPEQSDTGSIDVDTRSDIYSLGVLLYELLTGTTPLDKDRVKDATYDELRRMIRDEEPPRPSARIGLSDALNTTAAESRQLTPSRLRTLLNRDLDWIVMKAIAKERERRYESVGRLSDDIRRYLEGDSVAARPPSVTYKLQKLAARHRTSLLVAIVLLLMTSAGLAIGSALILQQRNIARREAAQADAARLEANQEKSAAIQNAYYANIKVAYQDWQSGQIQRMHKLLDGLVPNVGEPDLRGWEWYYLHSLCHQDQMTIQTHTGWVFSLAESPDGTRIASGSVSDNTVRIWDFATGAELACLRGHTSGVTSVAWSADGSLVASASIDGLFIWDAETWSVVHEIEIEGYTIALAWRPDSQVLAVCGYRSEPETGLVWTVDRNTGELLREFDGEVGMIRTVAWDPTARYLAAGENKQGYIQIWEPETRRLIASFDAHDHFISALAWSPDGHRLASGSHLGALRVFTTDDWSLAYDIRRSHKGRVNGVSWNGESTRLASVGLDGIGKIWDLETNVATSMFRGHRGAVNAMFWSRNEDVIVTAGADSTIKVWDVNKRNRTDDIVGNTHVAWSPDGGSLATRSGPGSDGRRTIRIVDADDGRDLKKLFYEGGGYVRPIAFSPDGRKIAAGMWNPGGLVIWNLDDQRIVFETFTHAKEVRSVDWSPDGTRLLTGGNDGQVHVWDTGRFECIKTLEGTSREGVDCVTWNPVGTKIAASTVTDGVKVWDAETYATILSISPPKYDFGGQYPLAWNPAGDQLAISCSNGDVLVVDAITGRECFTAEGNAAIVRSVAWSPDGTRLAGGGYDRELRIWDASNGREVFSFAGADESIECVAWSPEGRRIAIGNGNRIQLLDAVSGYTFDPALELSK